VRKKSGLWKRASVRRTPGINARIAAGADLYEGGVISRVSTPLRAGGRLREITVYSTLDMK
jgi:hypothetical protein